jgi:excinuclease ABC subunit C
MGTSGSAERLDTLRRQATHVPEAPGVYLMRDADKAVIYVGKAKDLRARLRTYFAGGDGRFQIEYLLQRVAEFETIVTQTEEQAFLLERDLITKYKPRYNIRLKDDKAYLSIRVDERAEWPMLESVRRPDDDGATYFGPYAFSSELRNVLEVIRKVIPLRSCSDAVLHNRQRPCLEYQIKRCCAPCCLPVSREEYLDLVKQAIAILQGRTKSAIAQLNHKMEQASEALRFEEAAAWRDRIEILTNFQAGHSLISFRGENRDVFGCVREGAQASLCVLMVRNGRIAETKNFLLDDVRLSDEELIESAIQQFYEGGRDIPSEILVPWELGNATLIEVGLAARKGRKVEISAPQRGSKARLVSMAELNARHGYEGSRTKESRWEQVATDLAGIVGLRQMPRRIECVDISNFQGSDTVGAIVVFFDGVADKSSYRRYKLQQQGKPNDFASIYEVVHRRLKRGMEEGNLPDLMVIDGGAGQLSMALQARDELKLSVDIVALAKMRTEGEVLSPTIERRPERLFIPGREESLPLDESAAVTRFLVRIRDEVHRFVISFHRDTRSRRVFRSVLDTISGVSAESRTRLLKHFKSVDMIAQADVSEVARVGRMSAALAKKIQAKLRKDD